MRQIGRHIQPVSRAELDRVASRGDAQITLEHPACFGKRVRVHRDLRARDVLPPGGDHAFALERPAQRDQLQRSEPRVPGPRGERHDTKRGAPTRMRRASRMIAPAYNK